MNDRYLKEDLDLLRQEFTLKNQLTDSTVFITGGTGLIGSLLIRTLIALNQNIKVVALVRNQEKAGNIFGNLLSSIEIVKGDVNSKIIYQGNIDFIFHCASVTSSKMMVEMPVETIITSVEGTKNVLQLAKEKKVSSMVYVSSMEMYGSFNNIEQTVTESDLGYIDPLNVRSNYPESKRLCENLSIAYYTEFGVPVKIARLAQTFGAGILQGENRVFAQFARSAIKGEDIVLHTQGLSEGNYCYSRDAICGLLTILLKGTNGEAYNVSNPKAHTTIAGMAALVADKIADGKIKVVFDIPESNTYGYAADTKMKLNSDKLQSLGWCPKVGLEEAYQRLIGSMKETHNY